MFLNQVTDLTFGEAAIYSIICILVVFLVLALICFVVWSMKFFKFKSKEPAQTAPVQPAQPAKKLTIDDITDEDMMAAALVATIDYRNEVKTDVRLVSIKQIN